MANEDKGGARRRQQPLMHFDLIIIISALPRPSWQQEKLFGCTYFLPLDIFPNNVVVSVAVVVVDFIVAVSL